MRSLLILGFNIQLGFLLLACGSNTKAERDFYLSSTCGYSEGEVSNFRARLANVTFPQEDGFMKSLLDEKNVEELFGLEQRVLPNDQGILSTRISLLRLNDKYSVATTKIRYHVGESPLGTDVVELKAEIWGDPMTAIVR